MIINTTMYMLIVGVIGLLKLHIKSDKILSWIMFFIVLGVFGEYNLQNISEGVSGFSVLWAKTEIGNISLDFRPVQLTNRIIIPLFFLSLLTLLNNNIFRYEEKRCAFNSFVIFNLISLGLLVCAENYVQLITMVFVIDILGYLILKDIDSSRRYVMCNFFADMCLFMILALACGKIHSLDMTRLLGYEQIGRHKDFVSMVTAMALFIKIGCFPFQGYLMDMRNARIQRMNMIYLLSSPLAGILLLLKLHNLLLISDLFIPIFKIVSILTFIVGISGFIIKRDVKKKNIFINMAFFGILLQQIRINDFNWTTDISLHYVIIYLFNQLYFMLYLYQNREIDILKMLNANKINSFVLKFLLVQLSLLNAVFLIFSKQITETSGQSLLFWECLALYVAQAVVLNHVYKSKSEHRIEYLKANSLRFLSFVINSILIAYGIYYFQSEKIGLILASIAFLGLIASPLGDKFKIFYEKEKMQNKDLSQSFLSYAVVLPLTYISRTIWLVLDIFLSEKIINATAANVQKTCIAVFLKINKKSYGASFLFMLIGIMIFILAYYGKGMTK